MEPSGEHKTMLEATRTIAKICCETEKTKIDCETENAKDDIGGVSAFSAFVFRRLLYYGVDGCSGFVDDGEAINIPNGEITLEQAKVTIESLRRATAVHREKCLLSATFFSQNKTSGNSADGYQQIKNLDPLGHIENLIDLDTLAKFSVEDMKNEEFKRIGDRNHLRANGTFEYFGLFKNPNGGFRFCTHCFELTPALFYSENYGYWEECGTECKHAPFDFNEIRVYAPKDLDIL
jgi:hypothetical protein